LARVPSCVSSGSRRSRSKVKVWVTFGDRLKWETVASSARADRGRGSLRAAAQSPACLPQCVGYLRELESVAGLQVCRARQAGRGHEAECAGRRRERTLSRGRKFRSGLDAVAMRHFERPSVPRELRRLRPAAPAPSSRTRCRDRDDPARGRIRPDPERLGDVGIQPEAVRFEIGAVGGGARRCTVMSGPV
jgi:hypothetical protein